MATAKLTKRLIDEMPLGGKQQMYFDTETKGFGLLVGATAKTFLVQYRVNGRTVRMKLGRYGVLTLEQARKEARQVLAQMARDVNPIEEKRAARARGITLEDAWLLYKDTLKAKGRSEKTLVGYQQAMGYIASWLKRPLAEITREEVRARHKAIAEEVRSGKHAGKYHQKRERTETSGLDTGNRVMRVFRAVWNRAKRQHPELPENPVANVDFFRTEPPRSAIPADALPRWHKAVMEDKNPVRRDYLLAALLTGLRRTDVATMRWQDVDLDNAALFVPAPKGGKAFSLPLSNRLVELLTARKAENAELFPKSPWVFAAASKSGHITEPRIDVPGLKWTPHDLRRTFITVAESLDISHYAIKSLVNHAQPKEGVTAGYISIDVERLRKPMQQITDKLLALCEPPGDNVVPIGKRKRKEAQK